MSSNEVAILIPARRAATRLPDKLLLADTGRPLLAHTCEQAAGAYGAEAVVVCADDEELVRVAEAAGVRARLTRPDHASGSDRIAEVAADIDAGIIVNVQGDEPELDPAHIRLVAGLLLEHDWPDMATLVTPATEPERHDPNAVKAIVAANGRALYFTRAPSPWDRDAQAPSKRCLRHLGIYGYRREVLLGYRSLPASPLEQSEKLEQLRALEAGLQIACATVTHPAAGIDTRADYDAFVSRWRAAHAAGAPPS